MATGTRRTVSAATVRVAEAIPNLVEAWAAIRGPVEALEEDWEATRGPVGARAEAWVAIRNPVEALEVAWEETRGPAEARVEDWAGIRDPVEVLEVDWEAIRGPVEARAQVTCPAAVPVADRLIISVDRGTVSAIAARHPVVVLVRVPAHLAVAA